MKKTKTLHRIVIGWIGCSCINEGANIYLPGYGADIHETIEAARKAGWRKDEIVEVTITYKKVEKL